MEKLQKDVIEKLMQDSSEPAVTIYIPMHTTASPPHVSENQIRLKNTVRAALDQLDDSEAAKRVAAKLEELHERYNDDLEFWEAQTPALLICTSPETLELIQLPTDTEEYVSVDDTYHLAPVLGLLEDQVEYYVLKLAQHEPELLKGNCFGLYDAGLQLPANLDEGLGIDENNQKSENQGSARGPSTDTSWFNGRGGARNPQEEDRLRFFRLIDAKISNHADKKLPLLLAGIESETVEYRSRSRYPNILESIVPGNQSDTEPQKLFECAHDIIRKEIVEPRHAAAAEEVAAILGSQPNRVAKENGTLKEAAEQGRVDKLLASFVRNTTDTIRDTSQSVLRLTFPDKDTSRQLNHIAAKVWQMSGTVINLVPNQMPEHAFAMAKLRY